MLQTQATEYRDLPLSALTESSTNPRRAFDREGLEELAQSILAHGVLTPLLVRPLTEQSFEIVAGARRFRAAQIAEQEAVPVRIVHLSDAEALEAQLIENLQRRDVHPLEEAHGFRALLNLAEPTYSIEQIAAKTGKTPAYVAQRLRLTELVEPVVQAFYAEEIGVGHALLLAKLQPAQQEKALAECFREEWSASGMKPRRMLLPVRHLQNYIERSLMLLLAQAPFSREDAELVPSAGPCLTCPKRTGHNRLLFADIKQDACTDPACYATKVEAFVQLTVAAKPKIVQISTSYGQQEEGIKALPRNKYVEVRPEKPDTPQKAKWPEYKTCRFTVEAIVSDGVEKGELRKVCPNPDCPVHHPKKEADASDVKVKADQQKQRREQALAEVTGARVLNAILAAVPVRLLKRDLLFAVELLLPYMDDRCLATVCRNHGIRAKGEESLYKLLPAYVRKSEEGMLGRLLLEILIVVTSRSRAEGAKVIAHAAKLYKVDTDAIALKVKQEFAAKEKAKKDVKQSVKQNKAA